MKTNRIILIVIFLLIFTSACNPIIVRRIEGSGNVISEAREVSGFDRITLSGFGEVTITQGDEVSLTVSTDDNIMPYVSTKVRNNTLVLGFTAAGEHRNFDPTHGIKYDLVVKDLSRIDVSGAGEVSVDTLETEKLTVDLSGAGSLTIDSLTADELVIRLSGAGTMVVSGQVQGQDVSHSGVGSYSAADLESKTTILEISGVGNATVWATESLDVGISGLGNVIYYGDPQISMDISGLGKLINADK